MNTIGIVGAMDEEIELIKSSMIIEKQNGTIQVENTYPGTKFTIHLYKENV